jgi:DNA-binding response OmpR family regulator
MAAREDAGGRRGGAKILLVEDDPDSRELLELILRLAGNDVSVAEDGTRGILVARAIHPDIAFVDIHLPSLDGYGVARAIRREFRDTIWLVALTALDRPEDRQRSIAAGFDLHLVKPVQSEEITALVRAVVSHRTIQ